MSVTTPALSPDPSPRLLTTLLVGIGAGFLSGLFGVGGGLLMVPGLVFFLGSDQRLAHGTSLAAVIPLGISSAVSYATVGEVDWGVALWLIVGSVVGAVLGTFLLQKLSQRLLAVAFIAIGVFTIWRLLTQGESDGQLVDMSVTAALALMAAGVLTGTTAGLLGVGGGIIMVPIMVVGFEMSSVMAKGTSLLVIVPTAIMGTWRNWKSNNINVRAAITIGVAGIPAGFVGGRLSTLMSEQLSTNLFALLVLFVVVQMTIRLVRPPATRRVRKSD